MTTDEEQLLAEYLLGLADDELILAHRNSEWTGHAPIVEEDIAFTNIALDEMGHAQLWYQLHAKLAGEDPGTYPDQLVFFREAPFFHNVQFVELPKGDWANSMVRQYLFDVSERVRLPALGASASEQVAQVAAKIASEEPYHLRHTEAWIRRLGLGTDESHGRTQRALDRLWGYALQLFVPMDGEETLVAAGLIPASSELRSQWLEWVTPVLEAAHLEVPAAQVEAESRRDHSEHLVGLLDELQRVARAYPGVEW